MKDLNIYQNNDSGSTVISNRFIDEYMKDANDAQLKVYLYLIRILSAHLSTSISEIADKFNHTEKDVMRSLKYWEKNQLLSLDYDEAKTLTGVHVHFPDKQTAAPSDASPSAEIVTIAAAEPVSEKPAIPEKPSYSLDQVKSFREKEDTEQLLFIIEQYIGKPLSTNEIRSILFIVDELGFSADLIDYLLQYCVDMGKKDFRYIEKVAMNWAEDAITTPKQAAALMKKYNKNIFSVMNALGKSGTPSDKEMEYMNRWYKEYQFSADMVKEACNRTVLATDKHRFEYAESILGSWKRAGYKQLSEVHTADEAYQRTKYASATVTKNTSGNKFNQFKQNSYDFSELEKEILSN